MPALSRAGRAGKAQAAALLASRGASADSTDIDRFIGACLRADRLLAERLLAEHPDLRDRMTDDDPAAVVNAPDFPSIAGVCLLLDLVLSPHARHGFAEHPLHTAAHVGHAEIVRLLLDAASDC